MQIVVYIAAVALALVVGAALIELLLFRPAIWLYRHRRKP